MSRKNKMTIEELMQLRPKRNDFEWIITEEKLVEIKVPKFKGVIGKKLCKLIRRPDTMTGKLNKIGSFVWQKCDGRSTVKDILYELKKEFPKEEKLDQRLPIFIYQLMSLHYISCYE